MDFVTTNEKAQFIRWFIDTYHVRKRSIVWFLNFLLHDQKRLAHIHLTTDAIYCPRAAQIMWEDGHVSFQFKKGTVWTTDVEKAFHDLQMLEEEPFYLEFQFPKREQSPEYAAVAVEHPYMPVNELQRAKDRVSVERVILETTDAFERDEIKRQIDRALDEKDEEAFLYWTKKWQRVTTFAKEK